MAKIPVRPPNTPREVKAAKSAIHQLEKRSAKIRRDIMNRRVDNLSEARRIAASQSAKAKELRIDLQNSPAVKYSKRNKYMRYRMPTKVKPARRQRRRKVPLRRSIQASIAAKNNRLQQSKPAKPYPPNSSSSTPDRFLLPYNSSLLPLYNSIFQPDKSVPAGPAISMYSSASMTAVHVRFACCSCLRHL